MPSRTALAWLKRQKDDRLAVDEIEALVATLEEAGEAARRLDLITGQLLTAETTLADVRAAAERENRERKARIDEARDRIAQAERESAERVQTAEREAAARVLAARTNAEADLAALKAKVEKEIQAVRVELANERALLADMRAQVEATRRDLARFVTPQA